MGMDLMKSIKISAAGMQAQGVRLKVIAENLAELGRWDEAEKLIAAAHLESKEVVEKARAVATAVKTAAEREAKASRDSAEREANELREQIDLLVRLLGDLRLDDVQFRECLLGRDAGRQPADRRKIELADQVRLVYLRPIERLEEGDVFREVDHLADLLRKLERRGQDADYRVWRTVERHRFAENRRVSAEVAAPECVGEDDDVAAASSVFFGQEAAAERRANAKDVEKIGRRADAVNLLRLGSSGQVGACAFGDRDAFEGMDSLLPDLEVRQIGRERRIELLHLGNVLPDQVEAAGLLVGKRAEQDPVDDAEDGGVCTDAKRQGEDCDEREAGCAGQGAESVSDVLPERIHCSSAALG